MVGAQIAGVPVYHADQLEDFLAGAPGGRGPAHRPHPRRPGDGRRLAGAGVRGIWNFTNRELAVQRQDVVVESVHFSDSLLALSYMISQGGEDETSDTQEGTR